MDDKKKEEFLNFSETAKEQRKKYQQEHKTFRKSLIGQSALILEIVRVMVGLSYYRVVLDLYTFFNLEIIPSKYKGIYEEGASTVIPIVITLAIVTIWLKLITQMQEDGYSGKEQIYKMARIILMCMLWYISFSNNNLNIANMFFGIVIWAVFKYFVLPAHEKTFLKQIGFEEFMTETELDRIQNEIEKLAIPSLYGKIVLEKKYLDGELNAVGMSFRVAHTHLPKIEVSYKGNWTIKDNNYELKNRLLMDNPLVKSKINMKMHYHELKKFIANIEKVLKGK